MNFSLSSPGTATTVVTALLSLPAMAEVPAPVTSQELAKITEEAASVGPRLREEAAETRKKLIASQATASDASAAVAKFLQQAAITTVSVETPPPAPLPEPAKESPPQVPATKPLEVAASPDDTVINCSDGMYFDASKGLLVYLKNVHVESPTYTLTGANELKLFLDKKEPAPADGSKKAPQATTGSTNPKATNDPKPADPKAVDPKATDKPADPASKKDKSGPALDSPADGFGSLDHMVATGAVHYLQKSTDPKNPPVEASGAVFNYDAKTGEIIIHGGYPWVKQGDTYMRANEPDLTLRIQKDHSYRTEGNWSAGGKFKDTGDDSKPKKTDGPKKPDATKPGDTPAKPTKPAKPTH